jgi:Uma2 family endonuclease
MKAFARENVMSITTTPPFGPPPEPVLRLSVSQYHEMVRSGILDEDHPVELLHGYLVQQMPKNPLHRLVTEALREALGGMLPEGFFAESQEPITLADSEPEPDVAVVRGKRIDYAERHPGPRDVALVVEVSDTSLVRDRGTKKATYAQARIAVYWIVNLIDRQIEVYGQPSAETLDYPRRDVYTAEQDAPVVLDGSVIGAVRLERLLPTA